MKIVMTVFSVALLASTSGHTQEMFSYPSLELELGQGESNSPPAAAVVIVNHAQEGSTGLGAHGIHGIWTSIAIDHADEQFVSGGHFEGRSEGVGTVVEGVAGIGFVDAGHADRVHGVYGAPPGPGLIAHEFGPIGSLLLRRVA